MSPKNADAAMSLFDSVFAAILETPEINERSRGYARYIGWLEGALMRYCPDEDVQELLSSIRVIKPDTEEATDIEPGSFY